MMKRFLSFALAFFLFGGTASAFDDVSNGAPQRLLERGVIAEAPTFEGNASCSRETFIEWAVRNTGDNGSFGESPYLDAADNAYITRAWELGLLEDATFFHPRKAITKFEAVQIALEIEGYPIPRAGFEVIGYTDVPEDTEMEAIIAKALKLRIVRDENSTVFGVQEPLTRMECAQILDAINVYETKTETTGVSIGEQERDSYSTVQDLLKYRYLREEDVTQEKLTEAAVQGMVESLEDPYTTYFNEEEVENFLMGVGISEQYGIGAYVDIDEEGRLFIVKPMADSPAEKAGLHSGDVVIKVDGVDVTSGERSLEEITALIKGEDGTPVVLTILRRGTMKEITVIRGLIQPISTHASVYDGYLVLRVDFFGLQTMQELQEALEANPKAAKKGIILDLRSNPGGFLDAATQTLSFFLPTETLIVEAKGRDFVDREYTMHTTYSTDAPIAVLINEYSASASEIVAGALQDTGRATILGETSFGKGTVQELIVLPDNSAVKITIAEWFTPGGQQINGNGVTPDYSIDLLQTDEAIYDQVIRMHTRGHWH